MNRATVPILVGVSLMGLGCDDGSETVRRHLAVVSDGGVAQSDAGETLRSGPFKMLVMSTVLEFPHDSIPAGQQMLRDLGMTADADLPPGAQPGSQFQVDIAKNDLSDFTDDNLLNYEIIFWMNPTGVVFSSAGANGVIGKAAVEKFMNGGGAWAGVHSATDFEKTGLWTWFQDNVAGGFFVSHNGPGTPGAIIMQPVAIATDHPAIRGLPTTWNVGEEWYLMDRNPENLPNFTILAKISGLPCPAGYDGCSDTRPVSWVHDLPGGGRTFYTIRGHDISAFAEPDFRKHVHQGILWAVHRMK